MSAIRMFAYGVLTLPEDVGPSEDPFNQTPQTFNKSRERMKMRQMVKEELSQEGVDLLISNHVLTMIRQGRVHVRHKEGYNKYKYDVYGPEFKPEGVKKVPKSWVARPLLAVGLGYQDACIVVLKLIEPSNPLPIPHGVDYRVFTDVAAQLMREGLGGRSGAALSSEGAAG